MASRADLVDWVYQALKAHSGKSKIATVAEHIWEHHEKELAASGDLFFTWQYDMRWAATRLRKTGKMKAAEDSPTGVWELA